MAQNIAGLMMVFTPEGMSKAMAMQAQLAGQPQKPATGFEVRVGEAEGDDTPVEIHFQNEDGGRAIATKWREVGGSWKVNDIGQK